MPKTNFDDDYLDDNFNDETGVYDEMLNPGASAATEEPSKKGGEPQAKKGEIDLAKELEHVKNQNKNNQELIRQMAEENKGLKQNFQKIGEVFNPNSKDVDPEEKRQQLEALFDTDPTGFVEQVVNNAITGVESKRHTERIEEQAQSAMEQINMEYDVDWKKNGASDKVKNVLDNLTPEFKHKDPKGALETAIKIAGVGKKKARRLPYYETSLSPAEQAKRQKTEAQAWKDKFMAPKKETTVLDKFFDNFAKS